MHPCGRNEDSGWVMDTASLCACMIVRNEETLLEECLASLSDLVQDIVVVDTGSEDRTVDIARRWNARVFHASMAQGFGGARNQALDHVGADWVLVIDADERVIRGSRETIDPFLRDSSQYAYRVAWRPKTGWTPMFQMRLFRNHPEIRYRGHVHAGVTESVEKLTRGRRDPVGMIPENLLLGIHLGYDRNDPEKNRRRLALHLEAVGRDPDNGYVWRSLGSLYRDLEMEKEAEEAWKRSIDIVRGKKPLSPQDSLSFFDWIQFRLDRNLPVDLLLDEVERLFPVSPFAVWFRGKSLLRQGRVTEAAAAFHRLLAWGPLTIEDRMLSYDERIFGEFCYASLGLCGYLSGRFRESERWYEQALRCDPTNSEYRLRLLMCEQNGDPAAPAAS